MKKILKNYIADAALLILLGLILLIKPGATLNISCRIIGAALTLIGAIKIMQFFVAKEKENRSVVSLVTGVVLAILGIWLLINPAFFIGIVPWLAGVVIAYGAVISLVQAVKSKKAGNSGAVAAIVLSAITLVLAIVVILHPAAISAIIVQLIGVSLIVEGVTLLVALTR